MGTCLRLGFLYVTCVRVRMGSIGAVRGLYMMDGSASMGVSMHRPDTRTHPAGRAPSAAPIMPPPPQPPPPPLLLPVESGCVWVLIWMTGLGVYVWAPPTRPKQPVAAVRHRLRKQRQHQIQSTSKTHRRLCACRRPWALRKSVECVAVFCLGIRGNERACWSIHPFDDQIQATETLAIAPSLELVWLHSSCFCLWRLQATQSPFPTPKPPIHPRQDRQEASKTSNVRRRSRSGASRNGEPSHHPRHAPHDAGARQGAPAAQGPCWCIG